LSFFDRAAPGMNLFKDEVKPFFGSMFISMKSVKTQKHGQTLHWIWSAQTNGNI